MSINKNPFTPTFGKTPFVLAGRNALLDDMGRAFDNGLGDPNLATLIVGARGTGKTALLTEIGQVAVEHGWASVSVSSLPGMLDDILEQTYRAAGHLLTPRKKSRITGVEIAQLLGVQWETLKESPANWRTKITDLVKQIESAGAGLLISVDEINPTLDDMKVLASVYQHLIREEHSVALVMAGLPHKVSGLLQDDDITFLRRARHRTLGRIQDADVRLALLKTAEFGGKSIDEDALDSAVDAVQGFPFMLQLVGYWIWEASGDGASIDLASTQRGLALASDSMREGVLESAYNELSKGDKRFVAAMIADDRTSTLADIAERMGKKSNYVSRYKRRLLERGVIGEYGRNVFRFDLPTSRGYFAERLADEGFI